MLDQKQCKLFNKVQSWAKKYVQNHSRADHLEHEPLHTFLTGDGRCGKYFVMIVICQSLTKTLSYGSTLANKPKASLMAPAGVATIETDDKNNTNSFKHTSRTLIKDLLNFQNHLPG